jgi:ABC-type antimicrobial peptide transport system permease subunit
VIDQYLVDRYFKDRSALGQQIRRGGAQSPPFTIVGVVGTINSIDLGQPVTKERLYYPVTQQARQSMALVIKTGIDPQTLVGQVRAAVQSLDPEQPIADVRTMDQWVTRSLEIRRTPMMLLALFGAVALVLSAIGIYGVLSYLVSRRVREIGIRLAIGAPRAQVLAMVLRNALGLALAGIALGLLAAAWTARLMGGLLHGVTPSDPATFATVGMSLASVAVLASLAPAIRATRIDPLVALKSE